MLKTTAHECKQYIKQEFIFYSYRTLTFKQSILNIFILLLIKLEITGIDNNEIRSCALFITNCQFLFIYILRKSEFSFVERNMKTKTDFKNKTQQKTKYKHYSKTTTDAKVNPVKLGCMDTINLLLGCFVISITCCIYHGTLACVTHCSKACFIENFFETFLCFDIRKDINILQQLCLNDNFSVFFLF